jgi:phosphatidylserine decarboxylase
MGARSAAYNTGTGPIGLFTRFSVSLSPAVVLQYLLPKRALTVFAGWCAGSKATWWTRRVIPWFIRRYGVNMAEAANPDPRGYATFNEFFTRALKPGARPLARAAFVCPVDGAISQFGAIEKDQIFQAKGHSYSTQALVGGDAELAAQFEDGAFATIYLSPRDYHRIHMPSAARLRRMIHVPGDLFSVNPTTARGVPGLFARNERVVCVFDVPHGESGEMRPFVQVLVGATIVGSMATVWHGVVNPPRPGQVREWRYDDKAFLLDRGEEMGCFLLGSTVVLLWPKDTIHFNQQWLAGQGVRMGEAMGSVVVAEPDTCPHALITSQDTP